MPSKTENGVEDGYVWRHGDLQLFGSDMQTLVLNSSTVVPDPFENVGGVSGIKIWRICKYRAVHWPDELYGQFYEKDVYVVLHTHLGSGGADGAFNIHLWVGKGASQDDYGTGAYKTAELDERLTFRASIHRQVQGKESPVFQDYFNPLTIWQGSADGGYFNTQKASSHVARLLQWYRPDRHRNNVKVKEVPTHKKYLNPDYVMIMDLGTQIYQWNGSSATKDDKKRALTYVQLLNANRGGKTNVEVIEEDNSPEHYFHFYLKDTGQSGFATVDSDDETTYRVSRQMGTLPSSEARLYTMQLKADNMEFKRNKTNKISRSDFSSQSVLVFDTGEHCFIWIGRSASLEDKKVGLEYAHEYLKRSSRPLIPVTVLTEDRTTEEFEKALQTTISKGASK